MKLSLLVDEKVGKRRFLSDTGCHPHPGPSGGVRNWTDYTCVGVSTQTRLQQVSNPDVIAGSKSPCTSTSYIIPYIGMCVHLTFREPLVSWFVGNTLFIQYFTIGTQESVSLLTFSPFCDTFKETGFHVCLEVRQCGFLTKMTRLLGVGRLSPSRKIKKYLII